VDIIPVSQLLKFNGMCQEPHNKRMQADALTRAADARRWAAAS